MNHPNQDSPLNPQFNLSRFDIIEAIRNGTANVSVDQPEKHYGLLILSSANYWMQKAKSRETAKMLFDVFWHEDELCIPFADTNAGKSILAVQIADSISRGIAIPGFKLEAPAQRVVYLDCELSDKQFERRYTNEKGQPFEFHENFLRAEINSQADIPSGFSTYESYLIYSIEQAVIQSGAKVLIIDNITFLNSNNEKASDALPLMKQLQALKKKYKVSMFVLAHTPKRDLSRPLTLNDVHGSKMVMNFCDSSFAIGVSHQDTGLRYLKQIKQRNTEQVYGEDNVCICQIVKPDNYLHFELVNHGMEWEHLRQPSEDDRLSTIEEVKKLNREKLTQRQIAVKIGISLGAVNKYLNS